MYALYASQVGLSLADPQYYLNRKQFDSMSDAFYAYAVKLFVSVLIGCGRVQQHRKLPQ